MNFEKLMIEPQDGIDLHNIILHDHRKTNWK